MISSQHPPRFGGFTLIELVVTMLLIGTLSAVVMNRISSKDQQSVMVQADLLRRNLSHLQLLAISQGLRLRLLVASGAYTVTSCPDLNCAAVVKDPATGASFTVNVASNDDGSASGVGFSSGTGSYYFDSLGRPVAAWTGDALNTASIPLTLKGSSRCVQVNVLPITGFAIAANPTSC